MSLYTGGETWINNMSKEWSTRQPLKALNKFKAWHKEGLDFKEDNGSERSWWIFQDVISVYTVIFSTGKC
jgi:hypothetical protein